MKLCILLCKTKTYGFPIYATANFFRPQCQRFDIERNVDILDLAANFMQN